MTRDDAPLADERWRRLLALLQPIHARAAGTARRLAGSVDDGDDLFQEAVLRAFRALPALRDESRFAAWFYAIVLSVHRNRHRRSFWKRFVSIDAAPPDREPMGENGNDWEDNRWRAERVSRALATLPPEQREAVVLFEIEGFSIAEIAAFQHVTESAVKSRVARGREKLRRVYERWGLGSEAASRAATTASNLTPALAGLSPEEDRHGREARA